MVLLLGGCQVDRRGIQIELADAGNAPGTPAPDGGAADTAAADARATPAPDAAPSADATRADARDNPDRAGDVSPGSCGSVRPDLSGIDGADGLAVAPDGTLYFTSDDGTDGWVGRLRPGQSPEKQWLRIARAPLITGLAFDGARDRLYVASVSASAILAFQVTPSGAAGRVLIGNIDGLNDVALDAAGDLYYTLQSDRHIYRVSPEGAAVRVTREPLGAAGGDQSPAGLAFAPDGSLFVGLKNGGNIFKVGITAGLEQSRAIFGAFQGWANGLAFDSRGSLYIGTYHGSLDTRVIRLQPDGANPAVVLDGGRFSSLAFGRGALDCHDLYIADPHGPLRRVQTDSTGLVQDRSPCHVLVGTAYQKSESA